MSLRACLSVCLSDCLFTWLPVRLPVCLVLCLSAHLSVCFSCALERCSVVWVRLHHACSPSTTLEAPLSSQDGKRFKVFYVTLTVQGEFECYGSQNTMEHVDEDLKDVPPTSSPDVVKLDAADKQTADKQTVERQTAIKHSAERLETGAGIEQTAASTLKRVDESRRGFAKHESADDRVIIHDTTHFVQEIVGSSGTRLQHSAASTDYELKDVPDGLGTGSHSKGNTFRSAGGASPTLSEEEQAEDTFALSYATTAASSLASSLASSYGTPQATSSPTISTRARVSPTGDSSIASPTRVHRASGVVSQRSPARRHADAPVSPSGGISPRSPAKFATPIRGPVSSSNATFYRSPRATPTVSHHHRTWSRSTPTLPSPILLYDVDGDDEVSKYSLTPTKEGNEHERKKSQQLAESQSSPFNLDDLELGTSMATLSTHPVVPDVFVLVHRPPASVTSSASPLTPTLRTFSPFLPITPAQPHPSIAAPFPVAPTGKESEQLLQLVSDGDFQRVQAFLEQRPNHPVSRYTAMDGSGLLAKAAARGQLKLVKFLVEQCHCPVLHPNHVQPLHILQAAVANCHRDVELYLKQTLMLLACARQFQSCLLGAAPVTHGFDVQGTFAALKSTGAIHFSDGLLTTPALLMQTPYRPHRLQASSSAEHRPPNSQTRPKPSVEASDSSNSFTTPSMPPTSLTTDRYSTTLSSSSSSTLSSSQSSLSASSVTFYSSSSLPSSSGPCVDTWSYEQLRALMPGKATVVSHNTYHVLLMLRNAIVTAQSHRSAGATPLFTPTSPWQDPWDRNRTSRRGNPASSRASI
jgi:hypothetical protein